VDELVAIDGIRVRRDITEPRPSFSSQLAGQPMLYSSPAPLAPNSKSSSNSLGSRVLACLRKAMKCLECSSLAVGTAIVATIVAVAYCLHLIQTLGYYSTALFLA